MPKKTTKRKLSSVTQKKSRSSSGKKIKSDHPTKRAHRMKDGTPDMRRIKAQNRIRAAITGTRNIDEAVHKLNTWLLELMKEMNWDSRERTLSAYRATIHALRYFLPYHDVVHMGEGEMRKVKALLREKVRDIIPDSLDKSQQPKIESEFVKNASP